MVDVRIKPLEWEKGVVDWARPLPGMKYVACSTTPAGSWAFWLDEAPGTRAVFTSEVDAKAAAQADYERRIRAALSDAVAEREAEPVAWMWRTNWTGEKWHFAEKASFCPSDLERRIVHSVAPLYTAPLTITDLEAENARLKAEVERLGKADETRVRDISRFIVERDAARDRVAELGKALEPFAEQADNPQWWNDSSIRREHLRAASRVREGGKVDAT